jgi:2-polyprenyl-3-methyl-5-hydroxy-6-metoxy-1,4-benzoquinol methylase
MNNKAELQEGQYTFPYHYLTGTQDGLFHLHKYLPWGLVHYSYIKYVADQVAAIKPDHVLDAGCGDGRMIYELQNRMGDTRFTGIDISEQALRFARAFNPVADFTKHDIISMPILGTFDTCVSIEVIEHIPPHQVSDYVKNIAKSLQVKGHFILTTPSTNIPTHPKHHQHFTLEKLREHLSEHFVIEEVQYLNIEYKLANILTRLLANKYFVINNGWLRQCLFGLYNKHCFHGSERTGSRIYIHAIKR